MPFIFYADRVDDFAEKDVQKVVAGALPSLFDDEAACNEAAASGVMSHVIALLETTADTIELETGLKIIDKLTAWQKPLVGYVIMLPS